MIFFIITDNFNIDIFELYNYIQKRITLDIANSPLQEFILVEYKKAYDKLIINSNLVKELDKPEFNKIINRLYIFECELFNDNKGRWDCEQRAIII